MPTSSASAGDVGGVGLHGSLTHRELIGLFGFVEELLRVLHCSTCANLLVFLPRFASTVFQNLGFFVYVLERVYLLFVHRILRRGESEGVCRGCGGYRPARKAEMLSAGGW
jgi:hypothetical protein